MTDEKFVFIEDCKDKKRTARGAFNKRTHCGKGGAIVFPSDYLTEKEKKAMNGKCETYRMNDPMKWAEFKSMPEDLQVTYITCLRKRFGVTDSAIAKMFGTSRPACSTYFKKLGLGLGRGKTPGKFDEDAWIRWLNGVPQVTCYDEIAEEVSDDVMEAVVEDLKGDNTEACDDISEMPNEDDYIRVPHCYKDNQATIRGGQITLEGNLYHIVTRLINVIGDVNVEMTVAWDLKED